MAKENDLFSISVSKKISMEEALSGIVHDSRFVFPFNDSQGNFTSSPVNILPVRFEQNSLEGLFLKDGLARSPFGFFDEESIEKSCYINSKENWLEKQEKDPSLLYLPIKFSESFIIVGANKNGKFTPFRNIPYATFGLGEENWPLILMYQDEKSNYLFKGLYYDDQMDNIKVYDRISDPLESNEVANLFIHNMYISLITSLRNRGNSGKLPDISSTSITKKPSKVKTKEKIDFSSVDSIVQELKKDIKGQDEALYSFADDIYLYMQQIENPRIKLPWGHHLFMGPSGVGKTTTARVFAEKAGLPFVLSSAGDTSAPGYVGVSFTSILENIASKINEQSPYGIVVIDEADKLVDDDQSHDNFFARRKQEILLGWTDGVEVNIGMGNKTSRILDTKNLLFMLLGAFEGYGGDG